MIWLELMDGLRETLQNATEWFLSYGLWGLALLSIVEAIFFPVPPDTVLIPLVGSSLDRGVGWALFLALVTTLTSVGGSWIGYALGVWGGRPVLNRIVRNHEKIDQVERFFDRYGAWAVAIAGFTPIPYKVFAIAGGVFRVNLVGFTLGGLLGRSMRFFLVALAVFYFGESILANLDVIFKASLALVLAYVVYLVLRARRAKRLSNGAQTEDADDAEDPQRDRA
ncbi:MAG: DedA family protein [candidate division WS1 bacterium]|nr:DedA family protein [candidate division WS1 bacterium]